MKAHLLQVLILDFDKLGSDEIKATIENQKYPNHCISPTVLSGREVDIGEWSDDHPLNNYTTMRAEADRLFNSTILVPKG